MPANSPEELFGLIGKGLNNGDLDGLVALYEPNACLVAEPGEVALGTDAMREAFEGFLSVKPVFTLESQNYVHMGDLVVSFVSWNLTGTDADGSAVTMIGNSTEVARQQPDATWLYVFDSPFGGA